MFVIYATMYTFDIFKVLAYMYTSTHWDNPTLVKWVGGIGVYAVDSRQCGQVRPAI